MNSSVGSSCSDSDFWALGHVGHSRGSSIVNLQCHLIQGIHTYRVIYQHYLSSCDFYFNSEEQSGLY